MYGQNDEQGSRQAKREKVDNDGANNDDVSAGVESHPYREQ